MFAFSLSQIIPLLFCVWCVQFVFWIFFLKKYFTPCFWRVPCVSEFFPKISDPVLMCLTCLMCFVCLMCFFVFHVFFFLLYFFCSPKNLHPVFDVFDVFQIRPRVFHVFCFTCFLFLLFAILEIFQLVRVHFDTSLLIALQFCRCLKQSHVVD